VKRGDNVKRGGNPTVKKFAGVLRKNLKVTKGVDQIVEGRGSIHNAENI